MKIPFTLRSDRRGAALIEYGLLVGLVALVAIGSVKVLGDRVNTTFTEVSASLSSSITSATLGGEITDAGPAGPMALTDYQHHWTFTAATSSNQWGYAEGSFGTLEGSGTGSFDINYLYYSTTGFLLYVHGNHLAEISSADRVECSDGSSYAVSETSNIDYQSSMDRTRMTWQPNASTFTVDESYTCALIFE